MNSSVIDPIMALGGKVGFFYKSLLDGDELIVNGATPLMAASVIKLPIMVEAFRQMEEGLVCPDELFVIKPEDKLPSCGALNVLHDYAEVTFLDIVKLMIVFSDNSATNLAIKRLGIDAINQTIEHMGIVGTKLNRLLFDSEASSRGIENYVSASGMGRLLELIYTEKAVSAEASRAMLDILFEQKLNGKLPLSLPREVDVAHKTGEDDGITHDVGIVAADKPYIICILSNEVDEPSFDMAIHKVSRSVYDEVMK